jgi:hypothetical protein
METTSIEICKKQNEKELSNKKFKEAIQQKNFNGINWIKQSLKKNTFLWVLVILFVLFLVFIIVLFVLYAKQSNKVHNIGDIKFSSKEKTDHNGWLLCNGRIVSRDTYSTLFKAIKIRYGHGDGINTFQLPDCTTSFYAKGINAFILYEA